jgi:ubiquinone/menaquinone biosynthesis C-methylase UbiE
MNEHPFDTIAEAFSLTAAKYDAFALDHPHLTRMRRKVYAHLARFLPPGGRILELNAGTGTDAVALARLGYSVHATDIAPGMLQRLRDKVQVLGLEERISVQECSFTDLSPLQGAPFDAVFSDLGGLNCIPDLAPVARSLAGVLRPGGLVTWVLMPPVCLWELGLVFSGQFKLALRRLGRGGTRAHLEGRTFPVYYFSPSQAQACFGPDYRFLALEGLSVITPTAESKNLARLHPRLYTALSWLDDRLSTRPPWWGWGDFYILSLRYLPGGRP